MLSELAHIYKVWLVVPDGSEELFHLYDKIVQSAHVILLQAYQSYVRFPAVSLKLLQRRFHLEHYGNFELLTRDRVWYLSVSLTKKLKLGDKTYCCKMYKVQIVYGQHLQIDCIL